MDERARELEASAALRREIAGQPEAVTLTVRDDALAWHLDALAADVAASGELLVTGMGASLHAGSLLAALLRGQGLRAWALPASELLHYGERLALEPLLIVSQSGASAVVPGGPERAFAATRSFTTSVAALYGLAARLGAAVDVAGLDASIADALGELPGLDEAVRRLRGVDAIFVTGRGLLHPVAEYVALLLMELARLPAAALEAGQFRHGPKEAAGERLGVVALAARGGTGALVRRFAAELAAAGSPTVTLDAGEAGDARSGATLALPANGEAGAALPLAVVAQRLAVELAEARGVAPGLPLRSSKVTREE